MKGKISNILSIIKIPLKCTPKNAFVLTFWEILFGVIPTIQTLATAKFINNVTFIVVNNKNIWSILPSISLVVICIGFMWFSHNIIEFYKIKLELSLRETFRPIITTKKASLKYHYIENDKTWDLLTRMSDEPEKKCAEAFEILIFLFRLILNIVGLLFILVTKSYLSVIIIVAISIPLFKIAFKLGKNIYDADIEATKFERRYKYLSEVLTSREYAEERTLFHFIDVCNNRWCNEYDSSVKIKNKAELKYYNAAFISGVITTGISIMIFMILINLVRTNAIDTGLCISLVISLTTLIPMFSWELPDCTTKLSKNIEYMGEMKTFFELEEQIDSLDKPSELNFNFKSLEFKNVSFKYPETDKYVLKNTSFIIENGKHYALVGVNGSGKTTISKLITGLYDNYEGEILLNDKELKKYSQTELKAICSVVYQDFAKYSISLKDNILLGNINLNSDNEKNTAFKNAVNAMELSDVINNLKDKENTPLGKIQKDGVDLSGGQWQRIAIARNIVHNSKLKILDEPTAALDPITESKIYEEFEKISRGNTTIFISHRLGSTKLADMIYVIDNGKVAESGSHNELLSANGIYADMYNSQKSWYM